MTTMKTNNLRIYISDGSWITCKWCSIGMVAAPQLLHCTMKHRHQPCSDAKLVHSAGLQHQQKLSESLLGCARSAIQWCRATSLQSWLVIHEVQSS